MKDLKRNIVDGLEMLQRHLDRTAVTMPIMSDEHWVELSKKNAVDNYVAFHGVEANIIETAIQWQRNNLKKETA